MMLLMGMWMSLTKNPMKPMMANPIAVAMAIFWNSRGKKSTKCYQKAVNDTEFAQWFRSCHGFSTKLGLSGLPNSKILPFLSGFVHLLTSLTESLMNCRPGSTNCMTWSMVLGCVRRWKRHISAVIKGLLMLTLTWAASGINTTDDLQNYTAQ